MYVLHVAPFDAARYPPLINTVRVCRAANVRSVVIASAPISSPAVLEGASLITVDRVLGGGAQIRFMIEHVRAQSRGPALIIAHNVRGLTAVALAAPRHAPPLVYHCHDFEGAGALRLRALQLSELLASRRTAEIWVPARERKAIARTRLLPQRVRVVQNCPPRLTALPEGGRLRAWLAAQHASTTPPAIIVRHGRIGSAHYVLETIESLPMLPPNSVFVVIGDGDLEYIRQCRATAARLGVAHRLFFHPFVPHSELASLLVDADVAMCIYAPTDINTLTPAPNKVFESMALGLPVVVASGNSTSDDVLDAGAGMTIPTGSREALAGALSRLLTDQVLVRQTRLAGRRAHLERFNYESQLEETSLGALLSRLPSA